MQLIQHKATNKVVWVPYAEKIPVLDEPEANVFSSCRTVNCIAVYGIYINRAGTFPLQNPCNLTILHDQNIYENYILVVTSEGTPHFTDNKARNRIYKRTKTGCRAIGRHRMT